MYGGLQRGLAAVKIGDLLPIDPQQLITCMEAKQGHRLQDDHRPSTPDDAGCIGLADLFFIFSQMPNLCIHDLPVGAETLSNAELLTLRSCQQRVLRGHVGGLGGLSWQAEHSKWKPEGLLHGCATHLKLKRRTFRARLCHGGTQNLPLCPGLGTAPWFWRVVEVIAPHWHGLRHAKSWTAAHLDQVILVHERGYRRLLVIELDLYILPT
mmetsp:Transcript_95850/g.228312  ORF Transcript_95850/g.228312 Transcript_95850/m.228312 type:complete len:210 (+) Transcript_95850:542-1171(+)